LVDEKAVAAGEVFGVLADGVCKVDGFLVDEKLLKGEGHGAPSDKGVIIIFVGSQKESRE